jgi:CRP-like cAMP-binding protein
LQRAAESLYDYTALISLHGWRVHRTAIHSVMADDVAFAQQMQALVRTSHTTIADVAACRGVHSVEQRFCRQLVMLQRAMGSEHIPVTRPMLAEMVPLSRGHAFRVAASLRGIVTFRVDSLTIDDLEALEHRACRCVQVLAEREAGIGES